MSVTIIKHRTNSTLEEYHVKPINNVAKYGLGDLIFYP